MTRPSVAVIVPNYNHARFLNRRLDSILGQSVTPQRIIVLDDCSTDESDLLIQSYAADHPEIDFIPSDRNSGDTFSQWNKGLSLVDSDYVWIAESDDWAEPDFLAELLRLAVEFPNAGIVYCHSDLIDEANSFIDTTLPHYADLKSPERWQTGYFNSGRDECRDYLVHRNIIPNASACLFKRKVLQEIGLASNNFRLCGDWLTYIRILEHADIAYSPRTLNHYRVHSSSVRADSQKALVEIIETYKVLNYLKSGFEIDEANLEESRIRVFERFHFLLSATSLNSIESIWKELLEQALRYDPHFSQRLASPIASTLHNVVVYFDENSAFSEQRHRVLRILPGQRRVLTFKDCHGILRFDPTSRAGLIRLNSISVVDQYSQDELWRADRTTQFRSLRLAGTCKLLSNSDSLDVYAFGADPQLILDGWTQSPKYAPDRVVEMKVDLETPYSLSDFAQ